MKRKNLVWAKRTRVGRMFCRLLGDRIGAVAMEYVVIALLVAAAVVAVVMLFGNTISGMFSDSITAISGNPEKAAESRTDRATKIEGQIKTAEQTGKTIQTGQSADGESGEGD